MFDRRTIMQADIKASFKNIYVKHILFWIVVFLFHVINSAWAYSSNQEVLTVYSIRVSIQIIIAYTVINVLIPKLLNNGQKVLFGIALFVVLAVFYSICTLIMIYYLEPTYPATYVNYLKRFSDVSFVGRLSNIGEFFSKSLYLAYPTFLLLVFKLYNDKQQLLELKEQKKSAELTALKNQLNPHFLFNTLNNLYVLALKKSDDTTKVIQKLSTILDYILYGCNDDYVALEKEIQLIENYLSLEKIRYGDRVNISFSKNITGKEVIAPLLLLTFIENAFKHGVTEEINQATINITITKQNNQLEFTVENSKPTGVTSENKKQAIGLKNIKKQLELLYPKAYDLVIDNTVSTYTANLKLTSL